MKKQNRKRNGGIALDCNSTHDRVARWAYLHRNTNGTNHTTAYATIARATVANTTSKKFN